MDPSDEHVVRLTRVLRAPPDEVFSAWTEPALLERWWAGVGGWVEAKAGVDLRVGGRYELTMRDDRGVVHAIVGVYTDISPPGRLGFTWTWKDDPSVMRGSEGSLVEVVLQGTAGGTQLSLSHSGLEGELIKDMHEEGWNALLTSLFGVLSA
jgi:uncharacterized protein YndB with AHSA1/START domain